MAYEPLVSIIIPCYNVGQYVDKAVESILGQTYANLEIWLIDDASTDDTLQKITSFNDVRIRMALYKENTKKVGAVNDVLQKVTGEYVAFQDADDWSAPDRIEKQVTQFLMDAGLGICFTGFRSFAGKKKILPSALAVTDEELKAFFLNFTHENSGRRQPPMCSSMMISSAALKKTRGYSPYFAGRVAEDIQWVYRILKEFKGITINEVLYNCSVRPGSLTHIKGAGKNAKFAYSWQLLSKIIFKDVHEGVDVLQPGNEQLLQQLELQSCEEALMESMEEVHRVQKAYRESASYKIGHLLLSPWRYIQSLINRDDTVNDSRESI